MWKFSRDGKFNMASAYALINFEELNPQAFMGSWVWKLDIWPKVSSFLWLCHHNNVPVRQVIAARGINCNTTCPLCKNQEESILHLLKDCPFAVTFWRSIKIPQPLSNLGYLDLPDRLKQKYLCNSQFQANRLPWNTQFLFVVWGL